jgi:hypothetical protein
MKEAGRGQLKSLRSFLRISLRSSAYSSTIRHASSAREGLLSGFGPEVGSLSSGIVEQGFEVRLTLAHRQQRGTPLLMVDLYQGNVRSGSIAHCERALPVCSNKQTLQLQFGSPHSRNVCALHPFRVLSSRLFQSRRRRRTSNSRNAPLSQPPAYNRSFSFTNFQATNPTVPPPGSAIDGELNSVKATLDATAANLAQNPAR